MKNRSPDRAKAVSELDALDARLEEVRVESRRLAEIREATERKLATIGKNLSHLRAQLEKPPGAKVRPKK